MELPFNHYSWLTTHNSYASRAANLSIDSKISSVMNQEDSITDQLRVCQKFYVYGNYRLKLKDFRNQNKGE